jgi:hypothetical protein
MSVQGNVNMLAQYPSIATAFVADFYNKMSRNRAEVVNLYVSLEMPISYLPTTLPLYCNLTHKLLM